MAIALDKAVMMATIMGAILFGMSYCHPYRYRATHYIVVYSHRSIYFRIRVDNLHSALPEKIATIAQTITRSFDPYVCGGLHGKR